VVTADKGLCAVEKTLDAGKQNHMVVKGNLVAWLLFLFTFPGCIPVERASWPFMFRILTFIAVLGTKKR
jgi:hypothetical protein